MALPIQIGAITPANLQQLRVVNMSTLPVRYSDKFYNELLASNPPEYCQFAFWNGFAVAAVCARVEPHDTVPGAKRLYIMTINVLAAYRHRGIGTALLKHVTEAAKKDPSIIEIYLHVQTSNEDACKFYVHHGFTQTGVERNYYKRIEPPDGFIFKKSLKEGHVIACNEPTAEHNVSCADIEEAPEENCNQ